MVQTGSVRYVIVIPTYYELFSYYINRRFNDEKYLMFNISFASVHVIDHFPPPTIPEDNKSSRAPLLA